MENLGLDAKLLVAQLVNFAIFFFVFQKFISKPFLSYLKKQKEEDHMRAKMAEELETRQETLAAQDKKLEQERKKTLQDAIEESKKAAETVKQEIIAAAKKEAEEIVKKAHAQIEDERQTMYKDVRKQVATVSSLVVEKALTDYLTRDAQEAVTKNIITHIPEDMKLEN